jgi:hypothetical protein
LAIATRRILISLGIGIVLGALMYSGWNVLESVSLVAEVAGGLIIDEGAVAEEMYILAFVVLLGVLTSFIYISGGLGAFSDWAITKVRTRFQAQLVPYVLGIIIFFDDAFSSLVGGNVSRTITDPHRISRAKLSYIVDSTAAPVIILVPISGWAAFIAATMTEILNRNEITQYSGYQAFLASIPTNFYAITAILFVFTVAYFGFTFGPMRKHERRAVEEGLLDTSRSIQVGMRGSIYDAGDWNDAREMGFDLVPTDEVRELEGVETRPGRRLEPVPHAGGIQDGVVVAEAVVADDGIVGDERKEVLQALLEIVVHHRRVGVDDVTCDHAERSQFGDLVLMDPRRRWVRLQIEDDVLLGPSTPRCSHAFDDAATTRSPPVGAQRSGAPG